MSRDLAGPCDQRVMRLCRWEPIKVIYHSAKLDGHRHYVSGDIMILLCHAVLQNNVIIKVSYHSVKFGGHSHYGSGVNMILVCHEISQDNVIKRSCDSMGGSPSW